jgi:hypothetical protein
MSKISLGVAASMGLAVASGLLLIVHVCMQEDGSVALPSFHALRPLEQHLVHFLLLLPPAALIVTAVRTLIGAPTLGNFSPVLLALALLDLRALPLSLAIILLTVLCGWKTRWLLDFFRLLQVARFSVLLTLVVMILIALVAVASQFGIPAAESIAVFPLVILTHTGERFWTMEAEEGPASSFKALLSTLAVAVAIALVLSIPGLAVGLFDYPETVGLILAAQLLLGRYTGYRLCELYRFRDLVAAAESGDDPAFLAETDPRLPG